MKSFAVLFTVLSLGIICLYTSCGKDDYRDFTKGGEIVYSSRLDTVMVAPGKERLQLTLVKKTDPVMDFVRVFWNSGNDSLEFKANQFKEDTMTVTISPLEDGNYNFQVYTYDIKGNGSVAFDAYGEVYGAGYANALTTRAIKSAELQPDPQGLKIYFGHASVGEIATLFSYLNKSGDSTHIYVVPDSSNVLLTDYKPNSKYVYRSLFKPEKNFIDTFFTGKTEVAFPLAENKVDNSRLSILELPTDKKYAHGWKLEYLWDENYGTPGMATEDGEDQWITIDLGAEAPLTRLKMWQASDRLYAKENVKKFEVYGSNDPNEDGSWESWTKILEAESYKPSGLPVGQNTEEDITYATNGENFTFPEGTGSYRYLRIKMLENWGNSAFMTIGEIAFWEKAQ